ncbi:hypothetical protein L2D14_03475 [Thalassospiraceae bacterium LMO-JJ14]|nr:hypothetical protein L2D14_03475 [Thalassospiraceae bacterium LMO-JJ14]
MIILCLFSAATVAAAYELSDNPAFCAGFLASQSDRDAAMMRTHETAIIDAFNRIGPKDSTDGRGYNEWLHIGISAARDRGNADYATTDARCRALIERIAK